MHGQIDKYAVKSTYTCMSHMCIDQKKMFLFPPTAIFNQIFLISIHPMIQTSHSDSCFHTTDPCVTYNPPRSISWGQTSHSDSYFHTTDPYVTYNSPVAYLEVKRATLILVSTQLTPALRTIHPVAYFEVKRATLILISTQLITMTSIKPVTFFP